ncbi:sphingosine kinase 2-like [Dysidea avara]|uniref:sphingosine kinase 2-like n=1 Tax=Dysidea avara TaxID=196820 RepID=UPI00331C7E41
MDVLTANTIEGTKYFCLLADWGIIADIDIESEKYRRIGEMRFFFGAISCIVRKKAYPGKLSYLPKDAKLQGTNTSKAATNDSQVLTEETSSPKEDGELVVTNGMESPTNETSDNCIESHHEISTTNNGVSEATADSTVGNEVNSGQTVPPTPFMNKLSEPVPSNWVEIDAEFMNIAVATISHLGHDIFNTKQAYVGCGTIYLVYAEANLTSRMDLFKLMDRMAKGNHTEMNIINVIEAKAFRIEPSEKSGILTLDGEMIPFGPMQAQIHPQLGRVLGRRLKRT